MKKRFAAAIAMTLGASTPAFAHHGHEYPLSACGTDGNTAHIVVTTIGDYQDDQALATILQDTFSSLMRSHTSDDYKNLAPAFTSDLTNQFGNAVADFIGHSARPDRIIPLDFNMPFKAPSVTPGCQ